MNYLGISLVKLVSADVRTDSGQTDGGTHGISRCIAFCTERAVSIISLTVSSDILLNVFLAIAVDNLADADALGENEAKDEAAEVDAEGVVYEVRATPLLDKQTFC